MKYIIGLGNIGKEYEDTRHNLGFLVIDELTKRWNLKFKKEFSATYAIHFINGEKIIIAKPNMFMNNSGQVIKGMINYFDIDLKDIIIFTDDKDQEMGKLKIINKGGHGGQNGVRNIIEHLNTDNFMRVKGGIGSDININTSNYVLGKWNIEQKKLLPLLVKKMSDIAEDFINMEFKELANKHNGK